MNKGNNSKQAANQAKPKQNQPRRRNRNRRRAENERLNSPIEAAAVAYANKQNFPNRAIKSRRIKNSELVATVLGSVSYDASQRFYLNPGLGNSFPWLSVIAAQWQQYRFHSLRFRYVTRSSTSTVGSIILSPDYNPKETPPTTEQQASNTQDAVEDVVWKELCCHLDPSAMFPFGPRKQIRRTLVAGDISIYDAARLFVCTTGQTDASAIGKLWVDYDVELFVPQNSPNSDSSPSVTSMFTIDGAQTLTTATPTVADVSESIYDPLGIGEPASGTFTPPAGVYWISGFATFSDSAPELFQVDCELLKNGSPIRTQAINAYGNNLTTGNELISLPFSDIVACSGSDTIELEVTATGAAGTLTVTAQGISMIWRMA
jgi:hypothetical protein